MFDPELIGMICIVLLPLLLLALVMHSRAHERLGPIRCNRCGHIGIAKGVFRWGRGIVPVCRKCKGDDWVVESH